MVESVLWHENKSRKKKTGSATGSVEKRNLIFIASDIRKMTCWDFVALESTCINVELPELIDVIVPELIDPTILKQK